MSNKRKIKLTEEDLQHGNNVKKIIKKDQAGDLAENLQESSLILKQAHLTKFFIKNKTQAQKPEPMEEEKKLPSAKEKMQTVTLTISDSESEDTHYSDKQEKQEKPGKQKKTEMQEELVVAAKPSPQRRTLRDMPNVVFYMNMSQSRPFGDYIEKIHRYWKGDYKKLESHHGFVQWLFPNYYGSAFNKDSFTLNPDEAMIFRENKEIAERLVRSYEMMLDFYGMQLVDKKTGKLARANHYLARYRLALLSNFHNHLRIKRILSHLSITGFRAYAIELVNFLEVEIYGEKGGYKKYLAETKPLKQEYIKKISTNPLFGLVKCDIFKDWSIYAEPTDQKELNFLMFTTQVTSEKEFEPSVLLRSK